MYSKRSVIAGWVYGMLPATPPDGPPLPYSLDIRWSFIDMERDYLDEAKFGLSNLIAGAPLGTRDPDWVMTVPHRKFFKWRKTKEGRLEFIKKLGPISIALKEFMKGDEK